jgi:hypothetical protein
MALWIPIVALLTALGGPGIVVAVTGDAALADEVAAVQRRVQESFGDEVRLVPDVRAADLDVHLHRVDEHHLQLTIRDGQDLVVDGPADTRSATAWVIVRAAVDRALIDDDDSSTIAPPTTKLPTTTLPTTTLPTTTEASTAQRATAQAAAAAAASTAASPWSADVCAGTTLSVAPDATFGAGAELGLGAAWQRETWIRVGVDAG